MAKVRWVGLDVHAETIAVAVADDGAEVRSLGIIPNRPEAVRRLVKKLGDPGRLRACYEAGPTGFVLYWQLLQLGVSCTVIAPTLVPTKVGDRVKTDRRDAERLVRSFRAGDLTAVWVPDQAHEALRDLVRAREAAKRDQLRARHRLGKFLLRQGRRPPAGTRAWSKGYGRWLATVQFDHPAQQATLLDYRHEVDHAAGRVQRLDQALAEAIQQAAPAQRAVIAGLQALRGVAQLTAASIVVELGCFSRFGSPRELMGYSGLVPREHSSGSRIRRGAITKTGNAHLRRVLVEAAWSYRHAPALGTALRQRQALTSREACTIAWQAQHRLYQRGRALAGRGKPRQQIATAVARELLGFMWAIGVQLERPYAQQQAA